MSQKKCTVLGQSMAVVMGRRAVMGYRVPAENQWALNLDRNLEMIGKTLEVKGLSVQGNLRLGPIVEMGDPGKRPGQSEWRAGRRGGAGGRAGWSSSAATGAGAGLSWNGEEERRRLEDDWRRGRGVVCCLLLRCIFPEGVTLPPPRVREQQRKPLQPPARNSLLAPS